MPVTVRGTDILFNDGTTQSTAAGGVPAFGAVGSLGWFLCSSTSAAVPNSTISGANLFYISALPGSTVDASNPPVISLSATGDRRNASSGFSATCPSINPSVNSTFTNLSGTWRLISHYRSKTFYDSYLGQTVLMGGLYVRVS